MANHVYFNITSDNPMENYLKREKVTRDWGSGPFEMEELSDVFSQPFMAKAREGVEVDEDGWPKNSWDWHKDNIGAKWCHLEDGDEDFLSGHSAWSPPVEMLVHMAKFFKDDLRMSYEDEAYCFVGVVWADSDGETSYEELEYDDLEWELAQAMELDELPEDFDMWDERDELEGISGQEWMNDFVWNWLSDQ